MQYIMRAMLADSPTGTSRQMTALANDVIHYVAERSAARRRHLWRTLTAAQVRLSVRDSDARCPRRTRARAGSRPPEGRRRARHRPRPGSGTRLAGASSWGTAGDRCRSPRQRRRRLRGASRMIRPGDAASRPRCG